VAADKLLRLLNRTERSRDLLFLALKLLSQVAFAANSLNTFSYMLESLRRA
jgi:hypothetical protein